MSDTTIDRVSKASLGLIADGDNCIESLVSRYMQQKLGHVARPEHLVHCCKVPGTLLRVEVGCEYAPAHALPPQELASPTRPTTITAATTTTACASIDAHLSNLDFFFSLSICSFRSFGMMGFIVKRFLEGGVCCFFLFFVVLGERFWFVGVGFLFF